MPGHKSSKKQVFLIEVDSMYEEGRAVLLKENEAVGDVIQNSRAVNINPCNNRCTLLFDYEDYRINGNNAATNLNRFRLDA